MANNPLITLEEYKTFAQISSSQQDDRITQLIPMVSSFVKDYCNRSFVDYKTTDKTEYRSTGGSLFFPKEMPVISVTSFQMKYSPTGDYVDLVENVDYVWDKQSDCFVSLSDEGFLEFPNAVKVVYKGGYLDIPEDLKLGVMDLVTYYLKGESTPRKSINSNQVSVEYVTSADLPHHIKRVFDLYRIIE